MALCASTDYYKVLGVQKSAGDREIKKAYRKLSKQYHPDKNKDPSAQQKFLEVGRAFEVLSNPDMRSTYDRFGEEGLKRQQQGGQAGGFHDPFDLFRQAFGFGGGAGSGQRKGQSMLAEMQVDLEAIYKGDTIPLSISRKQICEECDGTGAKSERDIQVCQTCEGRGIRLIRHQLAPGIYQQVQAHCDRCNGRGKTIKHVCPVCKGQRIVDTTVELNVHMDRGVPEGHEYVFEGEADESPDIAPGDVIVRIRSKQKKGSFRRKESNLYWTQPISLKDAMLGFKKVVKGLDGHDIILTRSTVTQPGHVDVIEGEGLPVHQESHHGDLFVDYVVVLPTSVPAALKDALRKHWPDESNAHQEL